VSNKSVTGDTRGHEAGDVPVDHGAEGETGEVRAALGGGGSQAAQVDAQGGYTPEPTQYVGRQDRGTVLWCGK